VERNKFVPNPKALGLEDMRNYYMIGQFLALAYRIRDNVSLDFPSIFWKYLLSKKFLPVFLLKRPPYRLD